MKHPATCIANIYRKREWLSAEAADCMEYTLKAFLNEISKVLIYSVLFGLFHSLLTFLLAYVAFVTLRLFAGGIHCKTYWGCFFLSFVFLGVCVFAPQLWQINIFYLVFVAGISCVFPLLFSPVTPGFRLIKNDKQKKKLKLLAVLFSVIWIGIAMALQKSNALSATVLYTVMLTNYQLFVPKLIGFLKHHDSKTNRMINQKAGGEKV